MGAICNYFNVVTSKLHIVLDLKEGVVKISQNRIYFWPWSCVNSQKIE